MQTLRQHRRYFASLAALVLLTKLAMGVAFHWLPIAQAGKVIDSVLGVMELCLAHTPDQASGNGGDQPAKAPGQANGDHCPACALVKLPALLIVLLVALLVLMLPQQMRWQRQLSRHLPDHLHFGTVRSRAPPLPA